MSEDKDNNNPDSDRREEQLDFGIEEFNDAPGEPLFDSFADADDIDIDVDDNFGYDDNYREDSVPFQDEDLAPAEEPPASSTAEKDGWLRTPDRDEPPPPPEPNPDELDDFGSFAADAGMGLSEPEPEPEPTIDPDPVALEEEEADEENSPWPEPVTSSFDRTQPALDEEDDAEDDWQGITEEDEDYMPEEELDSGNGWPIGLIAMVVIGLILLGGGGYGVMQQRAAMQEEIRQLRASLATTVSQEDAADDRQARRELELRNAELQQAVNSLQRENSRLQDTVSGLEGQLQVQQNALEQAKTAAAKPAPPKPAPSKPATEQPPAAATAKGTWFVNFSSYSQRETAQNRANKLKPAQGKVAITTAERSGNTLYRVRVIGLTSKAAAQSVARDLEQQYQLPRLWVGQQD
jgi:hypothetical protein